MAAAALAARGITVLKETCIPTLNPKICLGTSHKGGGKALYAKETIPAGESVFIDLPEHAVREWTWDELKDLPEAALNAYLHYAYGKWGPWLPHPVYTPPVSR